MNLYGYVLNNPVTFIDPLGLEPRSNIPPGNRPGPGSPNGPVAPAPASHGSGVNETTGPSTNAASAMCNVFGAANDWLNLLQRAGILPDATPAGPMEFPWATQPPKFHTTPPCLRP